MSDTQYTNRNEVTPQSVTGAGGMISPKAEFYNHFLQEYSDYFSLCCYADNERGDYRIHNGCLAVIGLVDSISVQKELRDEYAQTIQDVTKNYCNLVGTTESNLTEEENLVIQRSAAHKIVGKVSLWVGRHYPMVRHLQVGACRGPPGYDGDKTNKIKLEPMQDEYGREFNLAEFYARRITGEIVQDVAEMTVGFRGTGKSIRTLALCECAAAWVSYLVDNDPSLKGSRNYFNEDLVAIIKADRANEVMKIKGKYLMKDYDDITSEGWNSRNYASKENKKHNAKFMVNRTDQQGQFFSFPDLFTFDKVPRSMSSHLCIMVQNTAPMRQWTQHSLSKLYAIDKEFRSDNPLYRYLIWDRAVINYVVYPKCSNAMMKWYKEARNNFEDQAKNEDSNEEEIVISKPQMKFNNKLPKYDDAILKGCSHKEALAEAGISKENWRYAQQKGWVGNRAA